MKTLFLDCSMGAAGDMLTAALAELLSDPDAFVEEFQALGIPGVRMKKNSCRKMGITGTKITILVDGEEEYCDRHEHEGCMSDTHKHEECMSDTHEHEGCMSGTHEHDKHVSHEHHTLQDMEKLVYGIHDLPLQVKDDILSVYKLLADAESHVHGVPVTQIHFHEVGDMDALADITAVCMLMHKLAPEKVAVSPVHVGCGHVHCAHGILPVPAPATAHILKGVPIYGGSIKGELCTPTGAALLTYFADTFAEMPLMSVEKIGYGMGTKDFTQVNCIRAMLGETMEKNLSDIADESQDKIVELLCNLDDMTAEAIAFAMECILEAGALDVYTEAIGMKKSRPGTILHVLGRPQDRERLIHVIFLHTTTLGIREQVMRRWVLHREILEQETEYGTVRYKRSWGYDVERIKYEYEDLVRIAKAENKSIEEIKKILETGR